MFNSLGPVSALAVMACSVLESFFWHSVCFVPPDQSYKSGNLKSFSPSFSFSLSGESASLPKNETIEEDDDILIINNKKG